MTKPEYVTSEDGVTRVYQDGRLIATSSWDEARQSPMVQAVLAAAVETILVTILEREAAQEPEGAVA